ncbi:MAG TPA: biotin--[acetyl-CoA-carboxylase] ligase [Candidatus Omnitrophota bacterium]|nr:biotin--[acetyl-CoA-carboxylase] ligase [Candidatus Omnitrophota bacterium]
MREHILGFLKKKQGYVSGEEISDQLGISRQALWKYIQDLREAGYDILSVPHLGYQLHASPDRLFPFEIALGLNTRIIGRNIVYFDQLPSTMDTAMELGFKAAQEGTVVIAEGQSGGKGRLGRDWVSPRYKGLYVSFILRPPIAPGRTPVLTLLTAVGICEGVKEAAGIDARIKWPNDIMLDHKKLGGILTELQAEQDVTFFVNIGFGLNVNNDKKSLVEGAISLFEYKRESIARVPLLQAILRHIERLYLLFQKQDSVPILDRWRQYSLTLGRKVRVHSGRGHIEGEAVDIDQDGSLLVRRESGLVEKITSGDVVHCR